MNSIPVVFKAYDGGRIAPEAGYSNAGNFFKTNGTARCKSASASPRRRGRTIAFGK
jgi:hypothetical protein